MNILAIWWGGVDFFLSLFRGNMSGFGQTTGGGTSKKMASQGEKRRFAMVCSVPLLLASRGAAAILVETRS